MSIPRFWRNIQARYNLIGTECESCSKIYFPPRKFCPNCRRRSRIKDVRLSGKGKIITYTVIHAAPEGFERQTPYIMAVVQIDDGPRLTTQIVGCEAEDVKVGMRVEKVFRKIRVDGEAGLIHYGFKFKTA